MADDDEYGQGIQEDMQQARIRLRAAMRERELAEQANAGLIREIDRRDRQIADEAQAREGWRAEKAQRQGELITQLQRQLGEAQSANMQLEADAQGLREQRFAQELRENGRLRQELAIAQGVAKLVPGALRDSVVPASPAVEAGQATMIALLRQLVEMVGGNAEAGRIPEPGPAETGVSFPPEPIWPDAFRRDMTDEEYSEVLR